MARIRSIKPEFFGSLDVAVLSLEARLTFIGLWTHVDDDGRCIDDARLLKAAIWPLDRDVTEDDVDRVVAELAKRGRVVRYRVDDRQYLQVQGWHHQKIDRKKDSKLPGQDHDRAHVVDGSSTTQRASSEASSPDHGSGSGSDRGSGSLAPLPAVIDTASTSDPSPAVAGKRDLLWEAVLRECGIDPSRITDSARGAYNRAVKELKAVGAAPVEVPGRAAAYHRTYPDTALTPSALAKHWPQLDPAVADMPKGREAERQRVLDEARARNS